MSHSVRLTAAAALLATVAALAAALVFTVTALPGGAATGHAALASVAGVTTPGDLTWG
jgi:hypothetical protein